MAYKSEDIKKMNSILLLEKLYDLKTATMLELVEMTHFSQSSVRSILRTLETKNILTLQNRDHSTGGRCPVRYGFSEKCFHVLSVLIDEGKVYIKIKDIMNNDYYNKTIVSQLDSDLEKRIIYIVENNEVNCVCIASSGVVQDECFFTDSGDYMESHEIALNLKKVLDLPIIIENDVKCMMMGIQEKQHFDNLAYVYMSESGVGSSYFIQKGIVKGSQSFAGELGLLPYHDQTINKIISTYPTSEVLEDIYIRLLTTIAVTIDPQKIILSGKTLHKVSIHNIKSGMEIFLSKRYKTNIEISSDSLNDALNGLHYLGVLRLFDIYTDYERSHKNG